MNFNKLSVSFEELSTEKLNSVVGGYFVPWADYGSIVSGGEVNGGAK